VQQQKSLSLVSNGLIYFSTSSFLGWLLLPFLSACNTPKKERKSERKREKEREKSYGEERVCGEGKYMIKRSHSHSQQLIRSGAFAQSMLQIFVLYCHLHFWINLWATANNSDLCLLGVHFSSLLIYFSAIVFETIGHYYKMKSSVTCIVLLSLSVLHTVHSASWVS